MNIQIIFGLLTFLNSFTLIEHNNLLLDNIVGSKIITNEIPGASYWKKSIGYFVVEGKDTSGYTCIFHESKEDGKVRINLNIPYSVSNMTYKRRIDEFKVILIRAANDFNFDSLTSVTFGRLILSGDLAIDVTKEYRKKFGNSNKTPNYLIVEEFLKESKLGMDINNIFNSYSIMVEKVAIEKLFFTNKSELKWGSKLESDSANIPSKILDCIIWVELKKY